MRGEDVSVLVAGGGIVGLSAALFLAGRGVTVRLVERRPDALEHPRARVINPRTVEIYRQAGLEEAILQARSPARYSSGLVIRAETLSAAERAVTTIEADPDPGRTDNVTAASWIPIDQDRLERVVRARASEVGATVNFSTELSAFSSDNDGICATLADSRTGECSEVHARYLIAADGHRSGIRRQLGIPVHGPGTLGHTLCFVFEGDLTGPLRGRHLAIGHFSQPRPGTSLISQGQNRWVFSTPFRPGEGEPLESFTDERCAQMVRAAAGVPELELRIVPQLKGGIKTIDYEIGAYVAASFRDGPVFLAGDAAHVMPPAGAFGAGTGIQDAHNLAWKLAAVAAGQAGQELLDSYEAERLPAARFTLGQSLHLLRERTGREVPYPEGGAQVSYQEVVFGVRYRSGALVPEPDELPGAPGVRAPHVEVLYAGEKVSLLDLYGDSLVLLCGSRGRPWAETMWRLAKQARIPVGIHQFGEDLTDPGGRWETAYGVSRAGAVLVRPDGIVAWRVHDVAHADPQQELRQALAACRLWPAGEAL
jgi:putative polyketide hydroxylase